MTYESLYKYLSEKGVTLVAVSKTKPVSLIMELYEKGQRHFGENKVQELVDKHAQLPQDIHWHHIGHLQTNKVKYLAPMVYMIHAVDSLKLLKEINKQASKQDRVIPCLLQLKIAQEDSKFGLSKTNAQDIIETYLEGTLQNIAICGLMGMATFTDNTDQVRREFKSLKTTFDAFKEKYFQNDAQFEHISMGMSGDYEIAIEEGTNMVRIGSLLFGAR